MSDVGHHRSTAAGPGEQRVRAVCSNRRRVCTTSVLLKVMDSVHGWVGGGVLLGCKHVGSEGGKIGHVWKLLMCPNGVIGYKGCYIGAARQV